MKKKKKKNLPAIAEDTRVVGLGWEDALEEEMATHCSVLAWRTPWTEEPGGLRSLGFSRQEYWNRLPFLPPGHLPYPGIEPGSPALAGRFFTI